jgi:hypothetical protein
VHIGLESLESLDGRRGVATETDQARLEGPVCQCRPAGAKNGREGKEAPELLLALNLAGLRHRAVKRGEHWLHWHHWHHPRPIIDRPMQCTSFTIACPNQDPRPQVLTLATGLT